MISILIKWSIKITVFFPFQKVICWKTVRKILFTFLMRFMEDNFSSTHIEKRVYFLFCIKGISVQCIPIHILYHKYAATPVDKRSLKRITKVIYNFDLEHIYLEKRALHFIEKKHFKCCFSFKRIFILFFCLWNAINKTIRYITGNERYVF